MSNSATFNSFAPRSFVKTKILSNPPAPSETALTGEESIVLKGLVAGEDRKKLCAKLRMDSGTFYRVLRGLREKTGAANEGGLVIWALRRAENGDRRTDDRYQRYTRPPAFQPT